MVGGSLSAPSWEPRWLGGGKGSAAPLLASSSPQVGGDRIGGAVPALDVQGGREAVQGGFWCSGLLGPWLRLAL